MDFTFIVLTLPVPTLAQRHVIKTLMPEALRHDIGRALVFCAVENPTDEERFFYDIEQQISGTLDDLEEAELAEVEALFDNAQWCESCREMFLSFYRLYVGFLANVFGNAKWELEDTVDFHSFTSVVLKFKVSTVAQLALF